MDSNGPGSPRAIANFIITKLTDATIYVQDLIEAKAEAERRRVQEENDAARRRVMEYGDADESLMGDREAEEGRRRT
ncbi:hypothetical protein J4E85_007087 [Alternaria conjuncta]|uniref:uncharacterized protein n=1 Tax=Alternaria conjuncta TaxID=181017 RepID=UPI00221EF80A|nr:uncharacterized protein J4E85_007087 [Alternaria conjuncta]KAI4925210.1 hypothetical protein J4E85_007087 [Alternaria conjuncta]